MIAKHHNKFKMYAISPSKMDTLQVPSTRYPIRIQPMDAASFTVVSDDDDEGGHIYQNTLVSHQFVKHSQYDQKVEKNAKFVPNHNLSKRHSVRMEFNLSLTIKSLAT